MRMQPVRRRQPRVSAWNLQDKSKTTLSNLRFQSDMVRAFLRQEGAQLRHRPVSFCLPAESLHLASEGQDLLADLASLGRESQEGARTQAQNRERARRPYQAIEPLREMESNVSCQR